MSAVITLTITPTRTDSGSNVITTRCSPGGSQTARNVVEISTRADTIQGTFKQPVVYLAYSGHPKDRGRLLDGRSSVGGGSVWTRNGGILW